MKYPICLTCAVLIPATRLQTLGYVYGRTRARIETCSTCEAPTASCLEIKKAFTFIKGDWVRLKRAFKRTMRKTGSGEHVDEFDQAVGLVDGLTNFGRQIGPELDVRWQPDDPDGCWLRYAYRPADLALIHGR